MVKQSQVESPHHQAVRLAPFIEAQDSNLVQQIVGTSSLVTSLQDTETLPLQGDEPEESGEQDAEEPERDFRPIGLLNVNVVPPRVTDEDGKAKEFLPPNDAGDKFGEYGEIYQVQGTSRPWATSVFAWEAPAVPHRPLRFENVNLERYGYHHGMAEPLVSAAHFFGRIPVLPYMHGTHGHREWQYTLGHYRPGSYAPYQFSRPPVNLKGIIYQGGAVVGLGYLLP